MIFLDACSILRGLVESTSVADEQKDQETIALFERSRQGEVELTSSSASLAEVAFVLASPRRYSLPPAEITARLRSILQLRTFRLAQKAIVLRGLDVWDERPRLGFVDALTVTYAEQPGIE